MTRAAGIHSDIPMAEYVGDPCPEPSLSTTTAHLLLTRSARHAWWFHPRLGRHRGEDSSRADLGSAVHAVLFGGPRVVYAPDGFADWRKKDAQAFRDDARAAGDIPLLAYQRRQIEEIAEPARERIAALGATEFERTLLWQDACWCRSRPDAMSTDRILVIDYKTTTNAHPSSWIRSTILSGGYDIQAGLVMRGLDRLSDTARREFLFVVQEIDPPYCLSVIGLGPEWIDLAERKVDEAVGKWAACLAANQFPAYDERTHYAEPPTYALLEVA